MAKAVTEDGGDLGFVPPAKPHVDWRSEPASASCGVISTFPQVIKPGGNHLDRRRHGLPRDYIGDPDRFGIDASQPIVIPPGGDEVSALIAHLQHALVCAWRARGCRPSGAALARRFRFSKQTWSRSVLGQRWMGETVLAALVHALGLAERKERSRPLR